MSKVRVEFEFEEDVLAQATDAAERAGRSRDEFVEDAVRSRLAAEPAPEGLSPALREGLELLKSGAFADALDPEVMRAAWR